ncbi:MAG TPA: MFS transporter [Chloroflexaceae bacterium]|nr:MFS transporter [Chloroflexaceae bacterium]
MNRHPNTKLSGISAFYALLVGQFISSIGSAMTRFGLSVWVYTNTGSTIAYTTLLFFSVFPVGIGALIAGPLVDRWDRRRVLIVSDTLAGLSTLLVAALFFFDALALWHLYVLLSVNGIASAFSRPALDASVPLLVPRAQLSRAAGLSQVVWALEMILASTLAGFLIGAFGLGVIFLIDVVTFGANMLLLLMLAIPRPPRSEGQRAAGGFRAELLDGLRYVQQRPGMRYLLGLFTATMFLLPGFAYSLITPLVLTFAGETTLGLILSGFGVGSLVGGAVMAAVGARRRVGGILATMAVAGLAAILISLRENPWLVGLGSVITGLSFVVMIGLNRAIWQQKAAPDMLGRVFALQLALGVGAQSLGVIMAGSLADAVFEPLLAQTGALASTVGALIGTGPGRGMALMFLVVGMLQLVIVLCSVLSPAVRELEDRLPDAQAGPLIQNPAP